MSPFDTNHGALNDRVARPSLSFPSLSFPSLSFPTLSFPSLYLRSQVPTLGLSWKLLPEKPTSWNTCKWVRVDSPSQRVGLRPLRLDKLSEALRRAVEVQYQSGTIEFSPSEWHAMTLGLRWKKLEHLPVTGAGADELEHREIQLSEPWEAGKPTVDTP